jgi:RNA polymerase sigma factor (sigma-70 family)
LKPTIHLISACIKGKKKAQHDLYRLCFPYLMSISVRYHNNEQDAINVLNEAFFKILTKLGQFNIENSFKAWCRTILINTIISEHRKNKAYINSMAPTDFEMETGSLEGWEYDEINEQIDADFLQSKIDELKEREKTIFNLFALEGYSHKEISKLMDLPEGTSKWHLSKARKKLKAIVLRAIELTNVVSL